MFDFINEFSDTWANPSQRHAMLVHFPIVLTAIGVPLTLVLAFRRKVAFLFRTVVLGVFLLAATSGWLAQEAGEAAWDVATIPAVANELSDRHERSGERAYLFCAAVSVLVLISYAKKTSIRLAAAWLAFLGAAFCAAWVANTAHLGGKLVYEHSVGMPLVGAPPPAPAPDDDSGDPSVDDAEDPSDDATDDDGGTDPGAPDTDDDDGGETTPPEDPAVAFFRTEVRPILEDNCWKCHNEQRARRSGGLDQTSHETILAGGESGPAVVPGDAAGSLLLQRLITDVEDDLMPPMGGPLEAVEIEKIRKWIADGAAWAEPAPEDAGD